MCGDRNSRSTITRHWIWVWLSFLINTQDSKLLNQQKLLLLFTVLRQEASLRAKRIFSRGGLRKHDGKRDCRQSRWVKKPFQVARHSASWWLCSFWDDMVLLGSPIVVLKFFNLQGPQWLTALQLYILLLWTFNYGSLMTWMTSMYYWNLQPQDESNKDSKDQ